MTITAEPAPIVTAREAEGGVSRPYRRYVLGLLLLVYIFNFMDRSVLATMGQAIKQDMGISDLQLGLLVGLSFALLYTLVGIPIARIAERRNRVVIISAAVAVWSLMTALCGMAGSFVQLALYRVGVGIGEAGCTPPAHSLLSDYFPRDKRATALAIYSLGIPLGSFVGASAGGYLAQTVGWREAFFIVGLPGFLVALLVWATIRELPRGHSEPIAASAEVPALGAVLKRLLSKRAFIYLCTAGTVTSFVGYGNALFAHPFLVRYYHLGWGEAGVIVGVLVGITSSIGTLSGGVIADFAAKRDKRWYAWLPAIGKMVTVPVAIAAYLQSEWTMWVVLAGTALIFSGFYLGPTFACTHNMVEPRMRATATAILFFVLNLVGLGAGPAFVGWLSDLYAAGAFAGGDYHVLCVGSTLAPGCAEASAIGVRNAIITNIALLSSAAFFYLLAARHLRRDLEA